MAKPEEKNPEKTRPARLDMEDVLFMAGLVFVLVGLGITVGWGWGIAVVGFIMVGVSLWMTTPVAPKGGK